jgi:hypothetical protein
MSEVEKTVEETLAEAALQTAAVAEAKPKKERVKKTDADGTPKASKAPRVPKEPKAKKQYPQANEDGTPTLNEDGTPVLGAYATRYKEAKAARTPSDRGAKYPATAVITLLAEKNPKREGSASHARFAAYVTGQTVAEALAAGLTTGDFHHDVDHGFISIQVGEVAETTE